MMEMLKIAPGHDNVAELLALRALNPPMFKLYRHPLTRYSPYQSRVLNGEREWLNIGRPSAVWILARVLPEEMAFMLDEFPDGSDVTIRTFVKLEARWGNFNGTFWHPDFNETEWVESRGYYGSVELAFMDLIEIPDP